MGFPRQEYWSGLPFPSPGDLLHPRIEPKSLALTGGSLPLSHLGSPGDFWVLQKVTALLKMEQLHPQFPFDIGFAWTFTQQTHFWKCLAVLFLIIWGYSTFSIVSAPIYIPTLLFSTFISSFWKKLFKYVWGDKSLWFSFSLSWWLVRLRSFSFTPWPFVSSLEKMSIQVRCSFFKLGCLYFFYWVAWISYVFWLLTLYHIDGLQIFSYSLGNILILSIAAFAVQKVLV